MKVRCSRARLHDAFALAAMVVPQRTTIPAITSVRLTARKSKSGGLVELAATDLEYGLVFSVPATEIKQEGTLVLRQHLALDHPGEVHVALELGVIEER